MTSDEILMDTEERMEKAVNVFRDELRGWLANNQPDPEPTDGGDCAGVPAPSEPPLELPTRAVLR